MAKNYPVHGLDSLTHTNKFQAFASIGLQIDNEAFLSDKTRK